MPIRASLHDHVALRTGDVERAIEFWTGVFDAKLAVLPVVRSGGYFDDMFAPGARVKIAHLAVAGGGSIELFEFLEPRRPVPEGSQVGDSLMHFGVVVDDARAALDTVEAAGGRRIIDVSPMGGLAGAPRFAYCTDHEGHVFELLEADRERVYRIIHRAVPESRPPGWPDDGASAERAE